MNSNNLNPHYHKRAHVAGPEHHARANVRINGPTCVACHRPLLVVNHRCMCCGKEV